MPVRRTKALTLQVDSFPTAHSACGVPDGAAKGPVISADDCRISDTLKPNINLRYGVERESFEVLMLMAIVTEAMNDIDAVDIWIAHFDI